MKTMPFLIAIAICFCANPTDAQSPDSSSKKPDAGGVKDGPVPKVAGQVFVVTRGRQNIKLALVQVQAIPQHVFFNYVKARHERGLEQQRLLLPDLEQVTRAAEAADEEVKRAKQEETELLSKMSSTNTTAEAILLSQKRLDAMKTTMGLTTESWKKEDEVRKIKARIAYFSSAPYYFEKLPSPTGVTKTDADGRFSLSVPAGRYVLAATASRSVMSDIENYYWLVVIDASKASRSIMLSNDNEFDTKCQECVQPDRVQ